MQQLLISDGRKTKIGHASIDYIKTNDILTKASGFIGGKDGFDFTLNPYSGCTFGCSYCYAGFFQKDQSKRDIWGEWVSVKENAVKSLDKHKYGSLDDKRIYMSSVTDAYQPLERTAKLTRSILHELVERKDKIKLVVQTRGPLVVRDVDLFYKIIENGGDVQVNMTITSDDDMIRRVFEPYCSSNNARIEAIKNVQSSGIQACVTMTPLLMVNNPDKFADMLLNTEVKRYIVQSFHPKKSNFVYPAAATKEQALQLMADKLDCDIIDVNEKYTENYNKVVEVLRKRLPHLGEGREGFRPPF